MAKQKKPKAPRPPKPLKVGKLAKQRGVSVVGGQVGNGRQLLPNLIGKPQRPSAPAGALPAPALRPANNTTVDIYIDPLTPPAAPSTASVACHIAPDWRLGSQNSQGNTTWRWTHVMYCNLGVDIRDGWPTGVANRVYMPDKTGTRFDVIFVETVNRGQGNSYLRIFLNRNAPSWPTSNL
jgi:hypothetical protein